MNIIKRDGTAIPFDANKIFEAILKASESVPEEKRIPEDIIRGITFIATGKCRALGHDPSVEEVQDIVENNIMQQGYYDVAKSYILYRNTHSKIRQANDTLLDYKKSMEQYLKASDWRVKENASVNYSIGGLILSNSGVMTANYWLSEVYDAEIAEAHRNCDIHIHDLSMLTAYCAGWNLKQLITEGIAGVNGKIASKPATHLTTLCNQMVNFLGIMQNEWAGAQAFSSFDTYLAPFVKADNLSYKQVKQCIQSFIFGVNTPSRWGTQCPFSNITLDWSVPDDLANLPAIVGGKEMDFTYGDCKAEMDMINRAFIEVMLEGDANGRGFQYPIPTYSITKEFDWSPTTNNKLLFEMTAKYGTPYFSNYVNSDMKPSDVRSMCCRLRLDLRDLRRKNGGFFGAGESTGSVGVVTINMPRLAYLSENEADFYKRLDRLMDISARSLRIKREVLTKLLDGGLYPYTKHYLGSFRNHFSTIGLVGMNEAGLNAKWLRCGIDDPRGEKFAEEVLDHMRERLSDYQEKYQPDLYNLEATPAESTSHRFALHDTKDFPDIITAAKPGMDPFYTNSSHLPVSYTEDIFSALDIQDKLQTKYTSGTVFHGFLGEKLPTWESAATLVRKIAENYSLPYYTLSPTYSVCEEHGYISGEEYTCPHCGKPTEVYSRITGYYRPITKGDPYLRDCNGEILRDDNGNARLRTDNVVWNAGKYSEYQLRREYAAPDKNNYVNHIMEMPEKEDNRAEATENPVTEETECASCQVPEAVHTEEASVEILKPTLFKTETCPNCKVAVMYLDRAKFEYDTVLANKQPDLCEKYGIMQAPTLVVPQEDGTFAKLAGVSQIKGFLEGNR